MPGRGLKTSLFVPANYVAKFSNHKVGIGGGEWVVSEGKQRREEENVWWLTGRGNQATDGVKLPLERGFSLPVSPSTWHRQPASSLKSASLWIQ